MAEDIMRASMRLVTSGASRLVRIPKHIEELLPWKPGEELIGQVMADKSLRLVTLEQHFQERLAEARRRDRETAVGATM